MAKKVTVIKLKNTLKTVGTAVNNSVIAPVKKLASSFASHFKRGIVAGYTSDRENHDRKRKDNCRIKRTTVETIIFGNLRVQPLSEDIVCVERAGKGGFCDKDAFFIRN